MNKIQPFIFFYSSGPNKFQVVSFWNLYLHADIAHPILTKEFLCFSSSNARLGFKMWITTERKSWMLLIVVFTKNRSIFFSHVSRQFSAWCIIWHIFFREFLEEITFHCLSGTDTFLFLDEFFHSLCLRVFSSPPSCF